MAELHPVVAEVTQRIRTRSRESRTAYLVHTEEARAAGPGRAHLDCANLAHVCAAASLSDKLQIKRGKVPNIGIVTAYNDMLSAHQPLASYPEFIKKTAREEGCTAQVAGGVPAMCDGITQGQPGMELSLFSRDVVALAAAVALAHNVFDAVLCLGVCDKIVPGLMIGALAFGHLPVLFVPAGPMPPGLPNAEKTRMREAYASGNVSKTDLLETEMASYHAAGTCTFYGTANSNQMLMEVMGVHIPGTAFVNPGTPLREALTRAAAMRACALAKERTAPLAHTIDERVIVNAAVGLMATGGSANHAMHLPAIARAAGLCLTWEDMADISHVTPLLARIYPNGMADVNRFQASGGMAFLIRELLDAGLLHEDVQTAMGGSLRAYACEPMLAGGKLIWRKAAFSSLDRSVLRPVEDPFEADGGFKLLEGNLGRAIMKVSAVKAEHRTVEAPAIVFDRQSEFLDAFRQGSLMRDFVAVLRFQGPKANGMPELHKLIPELSTLQNKGFAVGLVTDGRLSGASGKVPAAIHVTPEAAAGGALARVQTGDAIAIDGVRGRLQVRVSPEIFRARTPVRPHATAPGSGRELFAPMRTAVGPADSGATIFGTIEPI